MPLMVIPKLCTPDHRPLLYTLMYGRALPDSFTATRKLFKADGGIHQFSTTHVGTPHSVHQLRWRRADQLGFEAFAVLAARFLFLSERTLINPSIPLLLISLVKLLLYVSTSQAPKMLMS